MKLNRKQLRQLIEGVVEIFDDYESALSKPKYSRTKDPTERPLQRYIDSGVEQLRDKIDSLYRQSEESEDDYFANQARELEHGLTGIPVRSVIITQEIIISRFNPSAVTAKNGRERLSIKVVIPKKIIKDLIEAVDGMYGGMSDSLDVKNVYQKYLDIVDKAAEKASGGAHVMVHEYTDRFSGIPASVSRRFKQAAKRAGDLY